MVTVGGVPCCITMFVASPAITRSKIVITIMVSLLCVGGFVGSGLYSLTVSVSFRGMVYPQLSHLISLAAGV